MAACRTRADKNNLHCKKISGRERARLESWEARHGDRVRCPRFRAADYCTVSWVIPMTPPKATVIVVVPVATGVTRPDVLIVATPVLLDLQVTDVVMSPKEPSEYVAVAVYCCCVLATSVCFADSLNGQRYRIAGDRAGRASGRRSDDRSSCQLG